MGFWGKVKQGVKALPVVGPVVSAIDDEVPDTHETTEAAERAKGVADTAKAAADAAKARVSNPGTISATTADRTEVGPAPINPTTVNVKRAGDTHAPGEVKVDPITGAHVYAPSDLDTLGDRVAGNRGAEQTSGAQLNVSERGANYQNAAALELQKILSGSEPSVAMEQLKQSQDRAAAEQLSQAAGARGQGVASARRNAALNTSLQNVEFGGQAAMLRAKEIADAASGLTQAGSQIRGQDIQTETTRANLNTEVELANTKARNDSIQSANERFARGEITKEQLESDIAKANADYSQRTQERNQEVSKETKMDHAHQELAAGLASDERLQQSFSLEAELEAKAAAGNQQAEVELQKLQATIDAQLKEFNAKQIQTASSENIKNRLEAMHLDDQFATQMQAEWLQAEHQGNVAAVEAVKAKIGAAMDQAAQDKQWHDAFKTDVKDVWKAAATKGQSLNGDGTSDVRAKEEIVPIKGPDIDGFLKSVQKVSTWKYKPETGLPQDRKIGPMANDVATSKLGREMVLGQKDDGTLTLDYQALAALALAGLGRLNERVEKVEGKKSKPAPDVVGFLKSRGALA